MSEMRKSYEILIRNLWRGDNFVCIVLDVRIVLKKISWKSGVKETESPHSVYCPMAGFCGNGKEPAVFSPKNIHMSIS
jgi:hypothetical protein